MAAGQFLLTEDEVKKLQVQSAVLALQAVADSLSEVKPKTSITVENLQAWLRDVAEATEREQS